MKKQIKASRENGVKAVAPSKTKSVPVKGSKMFQGNSFPIVGIGASAGGLEALELFFRNMPKDNGMAFVVIQHLDPKYTGIMPELLQRITPMTVVQVKDHLEVKPNSVYVIPPNKSMSLLNGTLHLFEQVETSGLRLPIDIFFRSLSVDREERSIGIILSGMGSDGSLGIKAIKEKNGIVLVQEPSSAKFDGMPRSAVGAVVPDIVAPAQELPAKLIAFLNYYPYPKAKTPVDMDAKQLNSLGKIIILLREQSGNDFSLYKKNTLIRRIERRMGIHQLSKMHNYVRFLQENPKEVEILFKELLIGVTSFFRDVPVWEKLKEEIFPKLIDKAPDGYILRAWVAGCSTGEEAYSLAIVFREALDKVKNYKRIALQIFASDIDVISIETARKGYFYSNISVDVPPELLKKYFIPDGEGYRVNTSIREMVVYAPQNVIKDPPFTKLDFLSCRNLLIYMEPELQKKLFSLFHYSLNADGVMLLGSAESIGNGNKGFKELDHKLKIYQRSGSNTGNELADFPSPFHEKIAKTTEIAPPPKADENIHSLAEQILLARFAPASVLVNNEGDIIYVSGRTGKYLELSAGRANWNIHVMARKNIDSVLPGAFRKAMQNYDPVKLSHIKVGINGSTQFVNVTVQRIESPAKLKGMFLVVFTDAPAADVGSVKKINTGKRRGITGREKEAEAELQRCDENLQSLREEMQTSEEELKSTNEELQSSNEELQSTNEELTTSKEEMQSMNEELQTVNAELQSKVSEFIAASDDMKNLLNSTEIATLFLDKELNIRRYTESAVNVIKLRKTDIGRPFTDLVSDLDYPNIEDDARQVLNSLVKKEAVITTKDKRFFNVRIVPFRTIDDRIDGIVMTFVDVTKATLAEEAVKVSEIRYRSLFEFAEDGILILDAETGMIKDVNPFLIKLLGYSKEQFLEKAIWEIGFLKDLVANKDKFMELQRKEYMRYENLPLETSTGKKINVEFISNVYLAAGLKEIRCLIRESLTQT